MTVKQTTIELESARALMANAVKTILTAQAHIADNRAPLSDEYLIALLCLFNLLCCVHFTYPHSIDIYHNSLTI